MCLNSVSVKSNGFFDRVSCFDVLLTMRISIILVDEQLDAQFFYFIIRLLQSSTCFEQRRAHHQEVKLYLYSIWYRHCL